MLRSNTESSSSSSSFVSGPTLATNANRARFAWPTQRARRSRPRPRRTRCGPAALDLSRASPWWSHRKTGAPAYSPAPDSRARAARGARGSATVRDPSLRESHGRKSLQSSAGKPDRYWWTVAGSLHERGVGDRVRRADWRGIRRVLRHARHGRRRRRQRHAPSSVPRPRPNGTGVGSRAVIPTASITRSISATPPRLKICFDTTARPSPSWRSARPAA